MAELIRSSYAFIVLVKALCGVGVFALPRAFKQSGLWVGMVLIITLGFVDAHSMIKLVQCSQYLSKKKQQSESASKSLNSAVARNPNATHHGNSKNEMEDEETKRSSYKGSPVQQPTTVDEQEEHKTSVSVNVEVKEDDNRRIALNYGDMAEEAFSSMSSEGLKKIGKPAKFAVDACIIGLQVGICSVYYVFVVDHTKEAIDYMFSTDFSRDLMFFVLLPFFLLIATVRNLTALSIIGLVGNILVTIAIVHVNMKMFSMDHIPVSQLPSFTSFEGTALAAGSIVYAYVAQAMVLVLENKMKRPQDMLGFFGVISMAVILVAILYGTTAFLGYITYGGQLKGSVTLNLTNSPIDFSVKIMLLLNTYCGYLVQHFPIVDMLWPPIERHFENVHRWLLSILNYAVRYAIVLFAFSLAYAIPNFKNIVPFVGITCGMALALLFPPILHIVVFIDQWKRETPMSLIYNIAHNIVYVTFGILFVIIGIYSSYLDMQNSRD